MQHQGGSTSRTVPEARTDQDLAVGLQIMILTMNRQLWWHHQSYTATQEWPRAACATAI